MTIVFQLYIAKKEIYRYTQARVFTILRLKWIY